MARKNENAKEVQKIMSVCNEDLRNISLGRVQRKIANISGVDGLFFCKHTSLYVKFSELTDNNVEEILSILESNGFVALKDKECDSLCKEACSGVFRIWFDWGGAV